MPEALYIIGNGFDLYHGMKTKYSDFGKFIKNTDSNLFYRIESYLPLSENWFNLEAALGSLDLDRIIDDASQFLVSYGEENWSDSGHHDYQYEIEQSVSAVSSELIEYLQEWISQVEVPTHMNTAGFSFESKPKFLNFNYTNTLEVFYGQSADSILHIHGDISRPILGHSWNPEELTPEWLDYSDENTDTRVMEGNETLKPIFEKTFKPTDDIIQENSLWFHELTVIESIYVFGHSLSEVDNAYFYEICKHINIKTVIWNVSYLHIEERYSHIEFMNKLGIKPELVEYNQLSTYLENRT